MPLHNPAPRQSPELTQSGNGHADQALAAIADLRAAFDPCDLLVNLFRATRVFGALASAYAHVVPDPEHAPELLVLLACHPERAYAHLQGRALEHPWLRYARDHDEPTRADLLDRLAPTSTGAALDGASTVLIMPTHSGGATGRFGALVLETDTNDNVLANGLQLLAHSLAHELHDWWMRRTRAELQRNARLRSDDLRLLALERQGLSTKQIARLINSSVTAVDSRFQRINAKLGVTNRRHAALRASIHGLL